MNIVYVLNRDFELLGIIDSYSSLIWRPSYSNIGDFELYADADNRTAELLQKNNYLVRKCDITADADGKITYKKVMIIKSIYIDTNAENGDHITVTGKELKYILHQRLIWKQTNASGTAENAIRKYLRENATEPEDERRIIPNLKLAPALGLDDEIEKQVTANPLDETIVEICNTYNYGWNVYIYDSSLIFELYKGVDRSDEQSERPYVVFSEKYENLSNTEYHTSDLDFANTALVGGEGEGKERKFITVNNENTGLDRFETFVNASGVRSDEAEMSETQYERALKEEGSAELAKLGTTEAFTGEIFNDVAFVYEKDFFLGDVVTVISKYGIKKNVRVISAIECDDESGQSLIPQFNM